MKTTLSLLLLLIAMPMAGQSEIEDYTWSYQTAMDKMTGESSITAFLNATNKALLHSLNRETGCSLAIAANGKYVFFAVDQGILNDQHNTVRVKFDDGQVFYYEMEVPSEPFKVMKIIESEGFIKDMINSKKMMVELPFYSNGSQIFYFETANFDVNQVQ